MNIELIKVTVKRLVDKGNAVYKTSMPYPRVEFSLRGRTSGRAYYAQSLIRLNPTLLEENEEWFINDTIPHEIAHLLAYVVYGIDGVGHGWQWQEVMSELGVEPRIRHRLDTSRVPSHFSSLEAVLAYE